MNVFFIKKTKKIKKGSLLKGVSLGVILYTAFALQTVGLQFTTYGCCHWLYSRSDEGRSFFYSRAIWLINASLFRSIFNNPGLFHADNRTEIHNREAVIILSTESLWRTVFSILLLNELITGRLTAGAILISAAILISETKLGFKKGKVI